MKAATSATLQQLASALEAQDREFASAHAELAARSGRGHVVVDMRDLQLLRGACDVSPSGHRAPTRFTGVRC